MNSKSTVKGFVNYISEIQETSKGGKKYTVIIGNKNRNGEIENFVVEFHNVELNFKKGDALEVECVMFGHREGRKSYFLLATKWKRALEKQAKVNLVPEAILEIQNEHNDTSDEASVVVNFTTTEIN